MNSDQQPFGQPSEHNPFAEMQDEESCRQMTQMMQQNFKDPDDVNNSLNSQLEHFVAVASAIIADEKVLEPNRDHEIAKARTIINAHWSVPPAESIILEDLSEDAPIILAKLENKAGYCLSDEQKKQALALIRSLQLDFLTSVEDVIDEMLEVPSLKHFAQLLNASQSLNING